MLLQNPDSATVVPGSIYLMDSDLQNVRTTVQASQLNSALSDTSVVLLDKIGMSRVSTVFAFSNSATANIAPSTIDFYLLGNMKNGPSTFGSFGLAMPHTDGSLPPNSTPLYARRSYFVGRRPEYENYPLSSIVDVKSVGAKGDGETDETVAIQNALNAVTGSNVIYCPSGSCIMLLTVKVPSTCRITG